MSTQYSKIGSLKVKNGTYTKDGAEKNRYHEVGVLFSSPHGSQMFVKMHATANSESKIVSIYLDDGIELNLTRKEVEDENTSEEYIPTADEIPF